MPASLVRETVKNLNKTLSTEINIRLTKITGGEGGRGSAGVKARRTRFAEGGRERMSLGHDRERLFVQWFYKHLVLVNLLLCFWFLRSCIAPLCKIELRNEIAHLDWMLCLTHGRWG